MIRQAIQLAQNRGEYKAIKPKERGRIFDKFISEVLLDKEFWQSLGKALGWEDKECIDPQSCCFAHYDAWVDRWHRFIDHLAEGKDPEEFFKELLKEEI